MQRILSDYQSLIEKGLLKIDPSAEIDDGVIFSKVDYPIIIGKNCQIAAGTIIFGGTTLGDNCQIGHYAIIDGQLGSNTIIGHHCVIEGDVKIGEKNRIYHHSVISGVVEIGSNNQIGPHATIGTYPQHIRIFEGQGITRIGNNNCLREYTAVYAPTHGLTEVGNSCYIMAYNHIPHDTFIGDYVTMSSKCSLAGTVTIMSRVTLGMGTKIHQESVIGIGVMLGMGSIVARDIPPYVTFYSGKGQKLNRIGMERSGRSAEEIEALRKWFQTDLDLPFAERVERAKDAWWYADFKAFTEKSHRKICNLEGI